MTSMSVWEIGMTRITLRLAGIFATSSGWFPLCQRAPPQAGGYLRPSVVSGLFVPEALSGLILPDLYWLTEILYHLSFFSFRGVPG